ncbi:MULTISPECIES: hypothetical protein [Kingella]|uniref:hypothetical protein n=1 Tax=Kingella TaxID=32257 RepID=UPI001F2D85E6|nr:MULTISPECIES: hypothetical protein [Kingella]
MACSLGRGFRLPLGWGSRQPETRFLRDGRTACAVKRHALHAAVGFRLLVSMMNRAAIKLHTPRGIGQPETGWR